MSDNMTTGKIIALITACLVLAGLVLWGVPYYIGSQVHAQVATELVANPHPVSAVEFNTVATRTLAMEATLLRMEQRMIERDEIILKYFQDQAGDGT